MSFLARTPICPATVSTDLGKAFDSHDAVYGRDKKYRLTAYDVAWLNAMRDRVAKHPDQVLRTLTDSMLRHLTNPACSQAFQDIFKSQYEQAMEHAYPLAFRLLSEKGALSGVSLDYTLQCIDLGLVRALEDAALTDSTVAEFVSDMRRELSTPMNTPRERVYRSLFDVYSEAIIYHLLKERGGARLKIDKIKELATPTPDFKCTLACEINGEPRELEFYIEVKSLDIVHAPQNIPEIREAAMDAQLHLERQRRDGKSIAMAETEIAPYRPYKSNKGYDSRSVRGVIETLIEKANNNFKATQFALGPTFALANLLRLPLPGQSECGLAPLFYDSSNGGACVSGVFWHMVFGEFETPIHRSPAFEGAGTLDGNLQRAGLLVKSPVSDIAAGLIAFYHEQAAYRFEGMYDSRWTQGGSGWSNVETEAVFDLLCGDYNSKDNSMAHKYAVLRRP